MSYKETLLLSYNRAALPFPAKSHFDLKANY